MRPKLMLIGLAGLFAALAIYSPNQATATAHYVVRALAEIGPWLAASVCVAAGARAIGLDQLAATSSTGFPAMVALWALVKPRAFVLYLGFAITGAMIAGYVYAATLALLRN